MEIEHLFRYPALAVGLKPSAMRGEARLRGLERAVADYLLKDHKPSASQGEARLRGLYQIIYSKTISPLRRTTIERSSNPGTGQRI